MLCEFDARLCLDLDGEHIGVSVSSVIRTSYGRSMRGACRGCLPVDGYLTKTLLLYQYVEIAGTVCYGRPVVQGWAVLWGAWQCEAGTQDWCCFRGYFGTWTKVREGEWPFEILGM
jgi:hypothetical protein